MGERLCACLPRYVQVLMEENLLQFNIRHRGLREKEGKEAPLCHHFLSLEAASSWSCTVLQQGSAPLVAVLQNGTRKGMFL